jgi:hypothetical protein
LIDVESRVEISSDALSENEAPITAMRDTTWFKSL